MSSWCSIRQSHFIGFPYMLVGYMRVSSESDRQNTNLQRDALQAAGVDTRHLYEDRASGAKDDRPGLAQALEFLRPGDVLVVRKLDRAIPSCRGCKPGISGMKPIRQGWPISSMPNCVTHSPGTAATAPPHHRMGSVSAPAAGLKAPATSIRSTAPNRER